MTLFKCSVDIKVDKGTKRVSDIPAPKEKTGYKAKGTAGEKDYDEVRES